MDARSDAPEGCPETGFEIVRGAAARQVRSEPDTDPARTAREKLPYDRGFYSAVVRGYLSVRQAVERGSRVQYALRLALRFGLSARGAMLVADNRILLTRALRLERPRSPRFLVVGPRKARRALLVPIAAALLACVLGAAVWLERETLGVDGPATPEGRAFSRPVPRHATPSIEVAATVRADAEGRPTEVVARTPRAVLDAYCQLLGPAVEPVRVVPSDGAWTGIHSRDGVERAILITKDRASGHWRVGDGRQPIPLIVGSGS